MEIPTLIYCAGGNKRFAKIAIDAGFEYGVQLPTKAYYPLYFADQNWKNPNRERYMAALAEHRPTMATVLDWEREEQLDEVLNWAEEAAQFAKQVLIIPKVVGGVPRIPKTIGGKQIVLAYSVPNRYSGTEVPLWEFKGWPIHLLGGSPHKQMELWSYFQNIGEVISIDGNMANLKATKWCEFWTHNRWRSTLTDDGNIWGKDAPYEAFRRSCKNIIQAWHTLVKGKI
jgi:hypothetical protein